MADFTVATFCCDPVPPEEAAWGSCVKDVPSCLWPPAAAVSAGSSMSSEAGLPLHAANSSTSCASESSPGRRSRLADRSEAVFVPSGARVN